MDHALQLAIRSSDEQKILKALERVDRFDPIEISRLGLVANDVYKYRGIKPTDIHAADTLRRLYNHAKPQGMFYKPGIMSLSTARIVMACSAPFTYVDYLYGRVLKWNLTFTDARLYNRDNGPNAAGKALNCKGCPRCVSEE